MKTVSVRLVASVALLAWSALAAAQTADDVIEKYLTALGGRAALAKLTSRSMIGTMTLLRPTGAIVGSIETVNELPNKSRTLIKLDLSALGAGPMVIDQRFDGTSGYVLDSMRGNRDMSGNQLGGMKSNAFPTPFLHYKERGDVVELGGKEKVDGRDAYVLIFKPKTGPAAREYIDAGSYLPVRLIIKADAPDSGEIEQTTDFSDYREIDGIKFPFMVKVTSPVQNYTIAVTKVEHNVKVDEALFSSPSSSK